MRILTDLYVFYVIAIGTAYFLRKRTIYLPVVILTLVLASMVRLSGMSIPVAVYIFCVMLIGTVMIHVGETVSGIYRENTLKTLTEKRKLLDVLEKERTDLLSQRKVLDERSFVIGKIYEVIKNMSGALRIGEILGLFAVFAGEHFYFSKCHFCVFDLEKDGEALRSVYLIKKGVSQPEEVPAAKLLPWQPMVIEHVKKKKTRETINKDDALSAELKIPGEIERLDVIPLSVENRMTAVVCVEDLEESQIEYFMVLATQLAMEIKQAILYEEVERRSLIDGLTGIYLRRYFLERTGEEMKRSERMKLNFSILMLDIDRFKVCNDTYGHMVGDVVLKAIAQTIKDNIRELDLVARFGGEEFAVLLPDTGERGALHVSERIRSAVEAKRINAYDETVKITISTGISIYPDHGADVAELIQKADKALYASKQSGRNSVTLYKGD